MSTFGNLHLFTSGEEFIGIDYNYRLEGLAHKVLQWYLCRMEGWFAADAETISLKCWDKVRPNLLDSFFDCVFSCICLSLIHI